MSRKLSRDDLEKFHDYGIHIPTRTVSLDTGTDDEGDEHGVSYDMAKRAIKNLRVLDAASDAPITLLINTTGGDIFYGMGIFDTIQACRSPIRGLVVGCAQSMGSVILQACDQRLASPNSSIMYHAGTMDGAADMPFREGKRAVDYEYRFGERIDQLVYSRVKEKKPTLSWRQFKVETDRGMYCTADEALEWGLIDAIEEVH